MVYVEVGNRMNLMLDLKKSRRYIGYCNSNLPPGTYKVTVVAIDKAGNAARAVAVTNLTVLDPRDVNADRIEDSLDTKSNKEQRVIVLHEGNLSGFSSGKDLNDFEVLPASSLTLPGNQLCELSKIRGVKGIYKDQKLKGLGISGIDPSIPGWTACKKSIYDFRMEKKTWAMCDHDCH